MARFFATADDLLPVLLSVEARFPVVYTPCEHVNQPKWIHFTTARDIPTLFQPQPYESPWWPRVSSPRPERRSSSAHSSQRRYGPVGDRPTRQPG